MEIRFSFLGNDTLYKSYLDEVSIRNERACVIAGENGRPYGGMIGYGIGVVGSVVLVVFLATHMPGLLDDPFGLEYSGIGSAVVIVSAVEVYVQEPSSNVAVA